MDAQECRRIIESRSEPLILVDVREVDEIMEAPFADRGNDHVLPLPLTSLMVLPKEEVLARLEDAARRIGRPVGELRIVAACRSGNRSRLATERFDAFGMAAENLEGGRNAWGDSL